jgi:hypothetical protein
MNSVADVKQTMPRLIACLMYSLQVSIALSAEPALSKSEFEEKSMSNEAKCPFMLLRLQQKMRSPAQRQTMQHGGRTN